MDLGEGVIVDKFLRIELGGAISGLCVCHIVRQLRVRGRPLSTEPGVRVPPRDTSGAGHEAAAAPPADHPQALGAPPPWLL